MDPRRRNVCRRNPLQVVIYSAKLQHEWYEVVVTIEWSTAVSSQRVDVMLQQPHLHCHVDINNRTLFVVEISTSCSTFVSSQYVVLVEVTGAGKLAVYGVSSP
eukprot:scaffold515113_cov15-Prasinocladus_malaysianus.AAC.1